jgi:hypothetical protein
LKLKYGSIKKEMLPLSSCPEGPRRDRINFVLKETLREGRLSSFLFLWLLFRSGFNFRSSSPFGHFDYCRESRENREKVERKWIGWSIYQPWVFMMRTLGHFHYHGRDILLMGLVIRMQSTAKSVDKWA